ncbi:Uncharacterised protein [Amycolatopsis camponoti]|uniref:Uncharacterized protein n=1 Tax=Amycolatopsis camponoti TaxID=2606593 RepID=A0A6I8M096_9PSEU|nr:Uncharacterised protein [Amycolatopsis camponoti]
MSRPALLGFRAGVNYVFRGCGAIPEWVVEGVDGFRGVLVVPVPPETIVFGTLGDPGSLPRILGRLEALGMRVASVHRVRELPGSPPGGSS